MRKFLKRFFRFIIVVTIIIGVPVILLDIFLFRPWQDKDPELTYYHQSSFDLSSSKPIYFKVNNKLYFSANGEFSDNAPAIWEGNAEELYISPNGKFALIYYKNKLVLIDDTGKPLFKIENCTPLIALQEDRASGRFISGGVQWNSSSEYFLILQDRIWDRNFDKKNKSSIYKYTVARNSFEKLIELNEEVQDSFFQSSNEKDIYYEFATEKGDLAFKKVNLTTCKIVSEHFPNDSLKLSGIEPDSVYFNYTKDQFGENSYDLKSIVLTDIVKSGTGLYYKNKNSIARLLTGNDGYNAFKDHYYSFFQDGYFLPGNRFFVANVSVKNFNGQIVIDTKTLRVMKLKNPTTFYFNINSKDCNNFVFREELMPNIEFASSIHLKISDTSISR